MPGILCFVGCLVLVLLQNLYILQLGASRGSETTLNSILFGDPVYFFLTIGMAFAIWKLGQFAFKRLILQPVPPEDEKE